jgi:hypothetical protein
MKLCSKMAQIDADEERARPEPGRPDEKKFKDLVPIH